MTDKNSSSSSDKIPLRWRWAAWLARKRWIVFILPFFVYMLTGTLEPTKSSPGGIPALGLAIPFSYYPIIYTVRIFLTLLATVFILPGLRGFRFRLSWAGPVFGAVGVVLWIWIARLDIPETLARLIGLESPGGERAAYNPFDNLSDIRAAWAFFTVRMIGLALLVPLIEELFLRGFLMRYFQKRRWWTIPFGRVDRTALLIGTLVPMFLHPSEFVAAAVWFSLITVLMVWRKNLWDCVVAHAVTNLLLGIYVVTVGGDAWTLL